MQTHQEIAKGVNGGGSFPSPLSYDLIFLTAGAISVLSVILVIILRRKITQSDSKSKLRIETSDEKKNMK